MKKLLVLSLALVFVMTFGMGVMAMDLEATGDDPFGAEDAGWIQNVGSLEGWTASNFTTLNTGDSGISSTVGVGVTVQGIKLYWTYPSDAKGKAVGEGDSVFNQKINYKVNAFANIPCYLEMNVFGNGAYANATNTGANNISSYGPVGRHYLLFDTNYGGVVDANWNFVASGDFVGQQAGRYIQGCDIFTANLFANVPYTFHVSSPGLAGLHNTDVLPIHMRTAHGNAMGAWSAGAQDITVAGGALAGTFAAMEDAHINMQFRVPFDAVKAGYYEGEVVFTMASM